MVTIGTKAKAQQGMEARIATGLKLRREQLGWSLNELATQADVSRAMISKIERHTVSPTASLLGKLCSALGITLSGLIASAERAPTIPLSRSRQQSVWKDPQTGLSRRMVSPEGCGAVEIVRIELPANRSVAYDAQRTPYEQNVLVLEGDLSVAQHGVDNALAEGDCLFMCLDAPVMFRNTSRRVCRYLVVIHR
jgi:transcriptional regulator with XRE-family HTH domain